MAEIDRLTVVFDARFDQLESKLNKVVRSNYGAASRIEKRWDVANDNIGKRFGKGIGAAFDNQLRGLASRAGQAEASLASFGLAGQAAAVAIGGLTLAVNRAFEAMKFGDELQTASDKLRISAEAMQELQFAADEADVPIEELREGLFKLNGQLGALKTGIGGKRVEGAFATLGITKESLKDVNNATELLPILADRLGQVGDTASQVQIARKLGIENLLPLLRQGSDGLEELRTRARALGLVLSNETVKGLADADRQMEIAGKQIQTNLRGAFAGLAVDIAVATTNLVSFVNWMKEVAKNNPGLSRALRMGFAMAQGRGGFEIGRQAQEIRASRVDMGVAPATAGAMKALAARPPGSGYDLADVETGDKKSRRADTSAQDAKQRRARERQVAAEIYRAELALLDLHNDDRRAIEDRLVLSLDRLDMERKQRAAELDELVSQYEISKGKEGVSQAERERLEGLEAEVRSGQERNLKDQAALDLLDKRLELEERAAKDAGELLGISLGMATTQAERRRIQLEMLETERRIARKLLEEELRRDNDLSPEDRAARLAGFDAGTAAQRGAILDQTQGPLEQFANDVPKTIDETNEALQNLAVDGLGSLSDALVDALMNAEDLGDAARNVFRQMAADFLSMMIKQNVTGPLARTLATAIPGFATGTNYAPGGMAYVHKDELINLPRGSQVIPGHAVRAMANMQPSGRAAAPYAPVFHLHAEGAVMTDQLIAGFNKQINLKSTQAAAMAINVSRRGLPSAQLNQSLLGTP